MEINPLTIWIGPPGIPYAYHRDYTPRKRVVVLYTRELIELPLDAQRLRPGEVKCGYLLKGVENLSYSRLEGFAKHVCRQVHELGPKVRPSNRILRFPGQAEGQEFDPVAAMKQAIDDHFMWEAKKREEQDRS